MSESQAAENETQAPEPKEAQSRYRTLPKLGQFWLGLAALASVFVSIYVIFGLGNTLEAYVPLETEYFYFMIAVLLPSMGHPR